MAVRSTMAALITRVRQLISDPAGGTNQQFQDQEIQDVLDQSRMDVRNEAMIPKPTFDHTTIQFLDYYTHLGDWEDDLVIKQYLVDPVTPTVSEPIAGHWGFAETTLPTLYITGKTYDVYRAAADLLERIAARWVLAYDFSSDGQSFHRSQPASALQNLARTYRMQQRAHTIRTMRSDIRGDSTMAGLGLGPLEIDRMGSGDGR